MEFDPDDKESQTNAKFLGYLQQQRERAAFYASIQRITFPYRFSRGNAYAPSPDSNPLRAGRKSVSKLIKGSIGACIEACPWLKFRKGKSGYPYYLWDVQRKCTVVVDDIESQPEYICVSHTWGRWIDTQKPYLSIANVPWLVPQNTRYRIEVLPDYFQTVFPGEYLWFDLFCIPQDRSERALQEIARQAQIFGNARAVVAWLNDIFDWKGLWRTIEWLSVYCLENRREGAEILPNANEDLETGLILDIEGDDAIPCGWFTSLWTLQEACLRPDMALCNADFELLVVGKKTVVTLDSLAALLNYVIGSYRQSPFESLVNRRRAPESLETGTVVEYEWLNTTSRQHRVLERLPLNMQGLSELYSVLVTSGMNKLFAISPASAFYLGQHRQCTSSRSEAIMSVVGATDWYQTYVDTYKAPPPENSLVMGYYHADFLNEAARKVGAKFYSSVASDLNYLAGFVNIEGEAWETLGPSIAIGSLLPFTHGTTTLIPSEHDSADLSSHPSLNTWIILEDGKVNIREAGVLSSTFGTHITEVQASILVPGIFSTTTERQIDLHEWIRSFRVTSNLAANYAISVYQQTDKVHWGLILKEVGSTNCLVKVGTFFTGSLSVEEVESQIVDWTVL